MVTIGNSVLPGTVTTIESASTSAVALESPADPCLIGEARLGDGAGNAKPNDVLDITSPVEARDEFGAGSPLAEAVVDALSEGARPVFAVAPSSSEVTSEDVTGGQFAEAPVSENSSEVSFTVGGTSATAAKTYGAVADAPDRSGSNEYFYNPSNGAVQSFGDATTATATYTHYDYAAAIEAMEKQRGERIDFIGVLTENDAVVQAAHEANLRMEQLYQFAITLAGASVHIPDIANYKAEFDSSRIQLYYPSRNASGQSIIGSIAGFRAALGIDNSPMMKRLNTQDDLMYTLSKVDQEDLVKSTVNPVADESRGSRLVDDLTCVADDNAAEDQMRQGIHRLVVDYAAEIVYENSQKFIGELHTLAARNALKALVASQMKRLYQTKAITAYHVTVEKVDAMTAAVNVGIDTVDPLRNIQATVSAGQIDGTGAQQVPVLSRGFSSI